MKMIPATCECGEEFMREPHDDYPRCSECFFEHDAPALKKLTDEVTKEEQRGTSRQEENRAAETETPKKESVMSQSTEPRAERFHPGVEEYTMPSFTDIDGTVHPGEHLKLRSVMEALTDNPGQTVGNAEVESVFYLYDIYDDAGQRSDSVRLVAVDEMGHSAEMTLRPTQVQLLTGWMVDVDVYVRGDSIFNHAGGDAA